MAIIIMAQATSHAPCASNCACAEGLHFSAFHFLSDRLESFDDVLRNMLRNILNVDLALESTWLQASLPVRMGGIGIRRAVQLAPSAYLASAAGCSELIRPVLPSHLLDATDSNIEAALSVWSQDHDTPPLSPPSSSRRN